MEGRLKISVIIAVAFVITVGTLSFSFYDISTQDMSSQSNNNNQDIGLGAYVVVEAYHQDGTMYQSWEGHNNLVNSARNALAGCISGMDPTPAAFGTCDAWVDAMHLTAFNQTGDGIISPRPLSNATVILIPEGCNPDNLNSACYQWQATTTFDFDDLECTPTVDCFDVTQVNSGQYFLNGGFDDIHVFNFVNVDSSIPIGPMDRLFVNMTFTVNP
jgi:hypothetical protein